MATCVVQGRDCQPADLRLRPRWRGRFPELLLEVGDAVAGGGEPPSLRKGAGDVVAGVGGFGGELVDLGLGA